MEEKTRLFEITANFDLDTPDLLDAQGNFTVIEGKQRPISKKDSTFRKLFNPIYKRLYSDLCLYKDRLGGLEIQVKNCQHYLVTAFDNLEQLQMIVNGPDEFEHENLE